MDEIEDLGDFFSNLNNSELNEQWQGFPLGYANSDEDLNPSIPNLSLSPIVKPENPEKKLRLDQTTQDFSTIQIDNGQTTSEKNLPICQLQLDPPRQDTCKRSFDEFAAESLGSKIQTCGTIAVKHSVKAERDDRKKSRERLRRQEVNVKFDELTQALGLSASKARKCVVLHEAVTCIRRLREEKEEWLKEKARMQQEMSKLATCLQFSHMGSAGNPQMRPMHQQSMMPLVMGNHIPCSANGACLPINPDLIGKHPPDNQISPTSAGHPVPMQMHPSMAHAMMPNAFAMTTPPSHVIIAPASEPVDARSWAMSKDNKIQKK